MVQDNPSPATIDLAPGDVLNGRYRIERVLGDGDRKKTFLAEDLKVGDRMVALSVVKPHAALLDPDGARREANLLSRIKDHHHIISFIDFETEGPVQYLVFEFLSGGTIAELIERTSREQSRVSSDTLLRYGRQIARALAQIHGAGIIHRDVAPHNIFLNENQRTKLTDFDSAVLLDDDTVPRPITTQNYASPEERRGDNLDVRSDLFSLGGVLVSLAIGELHFDSPEQLRVLRNDLPPELTELLISLVALSPDARPATAEEVVDRIQQIQHRQDVQSIITDGEGPQVEFKASMRFPRAEDELSEKVPEDRRPTALAGLYASLEKAVLKTIAAFLNSEGGTLLIGVEDDGKIVGIEDDFTTFEPGKQNADTWQLNLKQKVINSMGADVWAILRLTLERTRAGTVARVECPRRIRETWLMLNNQQEEFFIRAASSTELLRPMKAVAYIREHWS